MKSCRTLKQSLGAIFRQTVVLSAITLFLLTPLFPATAAQSKAAAKKEKTGKPDPAAVESTAVMAELPRSEFKMPAAPADGKDPFFPKSTRVYGEVKVTPSVTPTPKTAPVVDLVLSGYSGGENPIVTINNVNFGVGDNLEVVSGKERVRVVCLEINVLAGTAVVEANGVRRILRLTQSN
ncbi:MAG: hypothetical protein IH623_19685 [Verrucomicrobia bacterium]|nr:hypothetical protein [Verrucomicrobiota bacterium]